MQPTNTSRPRRLKPSTFLLGCLLIVLAMLLGWTVVQMPDRPPALAAELDEIRPVQQLKAKTGVGNPVTAVLLNFRAYDTMLELGVLVLVVLAVGVTRRVAHDRGEFWKRSPLLGAAMAVIVPMSLVVAGDLLWTGTDHPGGAFQAGAILGGAGIILILASRLKLRFPSDWRLRLACTAGLAVFLIVGFGVMLFDRQFLQYPCGLAKPLILAIETAAMASVAAVFVVLFQAVAGPLPAGGREGFGDMCEGQR